MMEYFDSFREGEDSANLGAVTLGVVRNNWNKDFPGKIQIELLYDSSDEKQLLWARVATPYGGNAFGLCLLPEIGSEVLVVYENGVLKEPVVIGCLWNNGTPHPEGAFTENNTVKSFLTKGGNKITITEEEGKEQILVQTKGELSMEMNDEKQTITLRDKEAKNSIAIDAKAGTLQIQADKKVSIKVGGNEMMTLDGGANSLKAKVGACSISADQSMELKGSTVNLKAQGSLKAEASGIAEIKGSMLKLN